MNQSYTKLIHRKNPKQTEFLFSQQIRKQNRKYAKGFGGKLLSGKRKEKRPLSDKKPMHLVLRSDSVKVFKPTNKQLKDFIMKTAQKYSIKIYELALNHNHIHFAMKLKSTDSYNSFIREVTSKMAVIIRKFLGAVIKNILSHRPLRNFGKLWTADKRNIAA